MKQLYTSWGEKLKEEMKVGREDLAVLTEYPRPSMMRDSYENLNGWWDYAITKQLDGEKIPDIYNGKILVPYSPEAALSGVEHQLQPDEYLWYHRELVLDRKKLDQGMRLLLHFGAVDQTAYVYVDGKEVMTHVGGYLPFTLDLTPYARESRADALDLVVKVKDVSDTSYHARGKQKLQRGGMYYTAQSGIWQTVWMEYVPAFAIAEVNVVADSDHGKVCFTILAQGKNETNELTDICKNFTTNAGLPVTIRIFASSHARANIETPHAKIQEISGKTVIAEYKDSTIIRKSWKVRIIRKILIYIWKILCWRYRKQTASFGAWKHLIYMIMKSCWGRMLFTATLHCARSQRKKIKMESGASV